MPRRSILAAAQSEELLAFPGDESEIIRLYTLSREMVCGTNADEIIRHWKR